MAIGIVVHGHFYQPPRENPWTGIVERQEGAEPYHDWNERIFHECYRPNAYARIVDGEGRVETIVNNYEHMSFNFGPTLLSWLEEHHSITYGKIIEADHKSALARKGHGNAIAQAYNHTILPLCSERDRVTQIHWGIGDFVHRFRRRPEAMWLPEAAADNNTLCALIDAGIKFTILSPYQAQRVRPIGSNDWRDASDGRVDPSMPYRYFHRDGSRRYLDIFFYDGPRSRAIAFENVLSSSQAFIDSLASAAGGDGRVSSVATDGESYGHHTHFGDRSLAHALTIEAKRRGFWVTNYAEYLDQHAPTHEVEISLGPDGRGSSWSCAHGVGRWFRDCACHTGGQPGWNQAWRGPLRSALDFLRDVAAGQFETRGGEYFIDPWAARNAYIQVILDPDRNREAFIKTHARRALSDNESFEALGLLEMQRHAMLMYTSCGWFFSDIAGIETIQILRYAGKVLDLQRDLGLPSPEPEFLARLSEARSNRKERGTGADIYRKFVEPSRIVPHRITAHVAIHLLAGQEEEVGEVAEHSFVVSDARIRHHGTIALCTGRVELTSRATGRKFQHVFSALHLGGVDFHCAVSDFVSMEKFQRASDAVWEVFLTASLPKLLRASAQEFGGSREYGLEHVIANGHEQIVERIYGGLLQRFSEQYANLYSDHQRTLDMLKTAGYKLPKELLAAAEFTLSRRFEDEIRKQQESRDPEAYKRAIDIAHEVAERGYEIDRTASSRLFESMVNLLVNMAVMQPSDENLSAAIELTELTKRLQLKINLERAQEAVYEARGRLTLNDKLRHLCHVLMVRPQIFEQVPEATAIPRPPSLTPPRT
ncbi:MAG: DUF3536 domain-containing protein [Deltaproteobacteria bacterium]|nr:DUF3536 domain-containing protein [Deltaproteobacteria bacterium]